jgi:peptidyl-prolyl cis-trans isomerase A (cyclophilin A)
MVSLSRRAAGVVLAACLAAPSWAADAPKVKFATSAGDIVIEVYPDKAPKTAENFLQYVREKHYDGTIFHRVIDNFMIQGGGMDRNMAEKKTRAPVQHEGREAYAKGLKNEVGTVAMARTSEPDSATSQFFINVGNNTRSLDPPGPNAPGYTVFGRVVSGMDVVNKIKGVPTGRSGGHGDVPVSPIVINSATLVP